MHAGVVLAEPHGIVRQGVRKLLDEHADMEVVGEAADGREAIELVDRLHPDIAVLAISLPHISGLELTRRIAREGSRTRVLILSQYDTRPYVAEAFRAGAAGYMVKSGSADELLRALDTLRSGQTYVSPSVMHHVVDSLTRKEEEDGSGLGLLTQRERDVLHRIGEGLSSKEIAVELGVSVKTVDSHRSKLMEKLGIHKVSGLVRFAIREGLVIA